MHSQEESACLRADDVAARYGGEEFAVLCPNATPESAMAVAERIRAAVAGANLAGILPSPTVSVGVALFNPSAGESIDSALKAADDAMYEAKHAGRNRVVVHASVREGDGLAPAEGLGAVSAG